MMDVLLCSLHISQEPYFFLESEDSLCGSGRLHTTDMLAFPYTERYCDQGPIFDI